ncbi:hypothetical protein [Luteolibacter sp. Populi]|uniref:hypothetical protein n=1 Tax=Luteolibacter sp. Populi TaxID=3230487 RepID=UPI003464FCE2
MSGEDDPGTEVQDFKDVLSTPVDGELPLVVGGHAVHLWALAFEDRLGDALTRWVPLTSKDLDLYGTQALLDGLKKQFGGNYRLSGPRGPVIGQLAVKLGGIERKIDVLRDVVGLSIKELAAEAIELEFEADGEWLTCRVLPLLLLFQAKVANLAKLDQTGRNDRKHVSILLLVVREYLAELIRAAESGELEPRGATVPLEQALKIVNSPDGVKCFSVHGIVFDDIWPRDGLAAATKAPLQNFQKHRLPPFGCGGEEDAKNKGNS